MGTSITVEGVPFTVYYDVNGFLITVEQQSVFAGESPMRLTFDPPVGPAGTIDWGVIYQDIRRRLGL